MSRVFASELTTINNDDMLSFLKNFQVQGKQDQYSIDQFSTFLQFLPLQQSSQLTLDERAQLEGNHRIMVGYLRETLSNKGQQSSFSLGDLLRVLQRDSPINPSLLMDICERQNRQDVLNTIGAFIKPMTERNMDEQAILSFLSTYMRKDA